MRTVPVSSRVSFPFSFSPRKRDCGKKRERHPDPLLKIELSPNVDRGESLECGRTIYRWTNLEIRVRACVSYIFFRSLPFSHRVDQSSRERNVARRRTFETLRFSGGEMEVVDYQMSGFPEINGLDRWLDVDV